MNDKELMRSLRPQNQLDLILSLDLLREMIEVRSTVIYDTDFEKELIVAQTTPPILHSLIGQEIEASFVIYDREANERRRYGFKTTIRRVEAEYQIRGGVTETAVFLAYPRAGVKESVVRLFHRVEPTSDSGLTVTIVDDPGVCHPIDLSMGGLQLAYDGSTDYNAGDGIKLDLEFQGEQVRIDGQIRRAYDRDGTKLSFLGVRFKDLDPETSRLIQRAVTDIMRSELKERSGLAREEVTLATPR